MENLNQSEDNKYIPISSLSAGKVRAVREDVFYYTTQIANLVFITDKPTGRWLLVDAGMPKHGSDIISVAEEKFGKSARPEAILLTHGHFDHIGSIGDLIKTWNVPVYAHQWEVPYLTGQKSYPEPDTTVEGGLLAKVAFIYPKKPVTITDSLLELPYDGSIPGFAEWKWLHTPGHTDGHVSFYRESDKVLISGDAFITVRQDKFYNVLVQKKEVNGPPRYLTTDWQAAWNSVRILESLRPRVVISGHGTAMEGEELSTGLKKLVENFDRIAIPEHGRFI